MVIDKIKILAENTMVGLKLFGQGEAIGGILVLSTKFEFLRRRKHIFLLSLKTTCPTYVLVVR